MQCLAFKTVFDIDSIFSIVFDIYSISEFSPAQRRANKPAMKLCNKF